MEREHPLLDLIDAKAAWARGEAGAERAADHAERVEPGWNEAALDHVAAFARRCCGDTFMIEDVRGYAEEHGLDAPPSNRAWGAVALRARRAGLIVRVGASYTARGPGKRDLRGSMAGGVMGVLAKALAPVSAYAAKKTTLWEDVIDRINGALLLSDLDELLIWLDFHELEIPGGWVEPIQELIEKRRDELRAEDISEIMRERFDF